MPAEPSSGAPPAQAFKLVIDACMGQAGLSNRALHDRLLRQTGTDLHANTIDSWRRPHSSTGMPVIPRDFPALVAKWLCSQDNVTVNEDALLKAWKTAKAAQLANRTDRHAVHDEQAHDQPPDRLRRGEWYEGIIDATIHLSMDTLLGRVEHRLRSLLNSGRPIPTEFAYLTHRGYLNWLALTEDRSNSYYRASVELYQSNAAEIAAAALGTEPSPQVNLLSLGSGAGTKDRSLVLSLLAGLAPRGGFLSYYPYDINPAMVVHATQSVLAGDLTPATMSVKGIIASFDLLGLYSRVYRDRDGLTILSLLGNTLGDMSDDFSFLETMFDSGMRAGDRLLLEVRCHADGDAEHPPGFGDESRRRFNFGPLEILGAVYDEHRDLITIRRERSRSVIPNTVTTVTRCQRVRCGSMTWNDVRLAYVHEYSEPDLDRALERIGYRITAKLHRGVEGAGQERVVLLYVLERP